jgi:transcriptional regulator GlxA family with amidase domain
VRDRLALSFRMKGNPIWIFFGKWPVIAPTGAAVGVVFVARTLEAPDRRHPIYERLSKAIEYMHSDFTSEIDLSVLARRTNVSVTQLERDFIKLVGMPPRRYQTKLRMDAAVEMLEKSTDPIVTIAHACGYSDQSAFTRRFHASVGVSPSEYRRAHQLR